ncbi:Ceramide very long chain fatty acid hydroxylase SCS7 [Cytospora mali]|uniref:Ceramide very long chain fatty acid hydroxylase n=1 Tax=Cytospora mali TaxID=578113 RepID=A0A194VV30_CYTMA|nr:Ceramide very long chain fatty acid hydroxylase SCS7 [Valsa mali]
MSSQALFTLLSDDVALHKTSESCYVIKNGRVYDVTGFLDSHPGGSDLILNFGGRDITKIFQDESSHAHSEPASELLEACLIGFIDTKKASKEYSTANSSTDGSEYASTGLACAEDLYKDTNAKKDYEEHKFLDLDRPLLPQMLFGNFSKAFYLDQIHRPRHYKGGASAPLYGNFLEPLSLTPWYLIPLVWLPPVIYGTMISRNGFDSWSAVAVHWGVGLFMWTLVEYTIHRFLFHLDKFLPDNNIALTLHFLLHGIHHYLPMDKLRLVMPPSLFALLATPFWKLAHYIFSHNWYAGTAVFCGCIFGYICYDLTHYFLHHHKVPSLFQSTKTYHLQHHFMDYQRGFGITSRLWDAVFGSQLQDVASKSQ